jgi:hypothetical protein
MSLWKSLRGLDRKFSWSFFGFLIAIISLGFIFYDKVVADKTPKLYLDVITSASVLDVKEDLPKLEISFDGIDIRQQKLSLRIISIKVINDSSINILKGLYDLEDPIGLVIGSGKIIKAELIDASNEYLRKNFSVRTAADNTVYFKDLIIEAHQYFIVKLLVLHPVDAIPSVKSIGHIAGTKEILVRETYKEQIKVSFWARVFDETWGVILWRLIFYPLIAIGIIVALFFPPLFIGDRINRAKRRRHVREFKETPKLCINEQDEFVFGLYISHGSSDLAAMKEIVKDDETLRRYYQRHEEFRNRLAHRGVGIEMKTAVLEYERGVLSIFPRLISSGFVSLGEGIPHVDPHMKKTLEQFIAFLKNKGLLSEEDTTD